MQFLNFELNISREIPKLQIFLSMLRLSYDNEIKEVVQLAASPHELMLSDFGLGSVCIESMYNACAGT